MGAVEIGEIALTSDAPPHLTPGTQCTIERTPNGHYTLCAKSSTRAFSDGANGGASTNESLYTFKLPLKGRRLWAGSLVEAIGYAVEVYSFEAKGGVVEATEETCTIRFTISVPPVFIEEKRIGRLHRHMARLFANLSPTGGGSAREPVHVDVRKQLHSAKVSELFPLLRTVDETLTETVYAPDDDRSELEKLPHALLCKIFDMCDPASFRALQSCSRLLYATGRDAIPAIKTELCAHQRKSLKWMVWREQPGRKLPHPYKQYIQTEWGTLEADELTGTLLSRDKTLLDDIRGGILADEPGLGKTATILSLIMRTRGLLPVAPEGCVTTLRTGTNLETVGWYKMVEQELGRRSSSVSLRTRQTDPHTGKVLLQSFSFDQLNGASSSQGHLETPYPKRQKEHSFAAEGGTEMAEAASSSHLSEPSNFEGLGVEGRDFTLVDFVQCDVCNKWRPVPTGYKVDPEEWWQCSMHPSSEISDCEMPDEDSHEEDLMEIDYVMADLGYVPPSKVSVTKDNHMHFHLRLPFSDALQSPHNAFLFLCQLSSAELHQGFAVPEEYRLPWDYAFVYQTFGLERITSGKRPCMGDDPQHRWKIPESHRHLDLDTVALEEELMSRLGERNDKTYLSAATLIVVPFPLIEQWKHEITKHFRGRHLRVYVVTKSVDYPYRVCQLAWCYDVVLTSFTHLSSAVSDRLLQVHWFRVVLDEGHLIGATLSKTSRKMRISQLKTDRRWIITGTPTPDLARQSTVSHLYPLIKFLKIEPFESSRTAWENAIQKPFEAGLPEGKRRLLTLMNTLMIRTFKDEIRGLVRIHREVSSLQFEPAHAGSYNELVEVVMRNLMLADFGEESHEESLLNPLNNKWSSEMLRNVHMSCCVAGTCWLSVNAAQLRDTLMKLADRNGYSTEFMDGLPWWVPFHHPLRGVEDGLRHGGPCSCCHEINRMPVVTPCAHLLCISCLERDREKCAACGKHYTMQSVDDPIRLTHNKDPKHPVPMEVIEWQPSYTQLGAVGKSGGGWQPNWRETQSSKCKQLVSRLRELGIVEPTKKGPKAIVFSRFWPHVNLIESCLIDAKIPHCLLRKDLKPRQKNSVVDIFRTSPDFNVLLMDTTGAVGLDLSMACWVFLMEPLLDKSLEEQIISRAHRMGAETDIHVETMIMKGSVEEDLLRRFISSEAEMPSDVSEDNRAIRNTLITGLQKVSKKDTTAV